MLAATSTGMIVWIILVLFKADDIVLQVQRKASWLAVSMFQLPDVLSKAIVLELE